MSKKLGQPEAGLSGARVLTRREAALLHVSPSFIVMREHDSERLTFWTRARGGGLDRRALEREQERVEQLKKYWREP